MKKMIFALILISTASLVSAEEVTCRISLNTEIQSETSFEIEANSKVLVGEIDGFRISLNNHGSSKYELEIFDPSGPSRSYAAGILKNPQDEITWTLWSREVLLDSSCHLTK